MTPFCAAVLLAGEVDDDPSRVLDVADQLQARLGLRLDR